MNVQVGDEGTELTGILRGSNRITHTKTQSIASAQEISAAIVNIINCILKGVWVLARQMGDTSRVLGNREAAWQRHKV